MQIETIVFYGGVAFLHAASFCLTYAIVMGKFANRPVPHLLTLALYFGGVYLAIGRDLDSVTLILRAAAMLAGVAMYVGMCLWLDDWVTKRVDWVLRTLSRRKK